MDSQQYSTSWLYDDDVYTVMTKNISILNSSATLAVIARFQICPEDEDAFCRVCQSQKIMGDEFLAIRWPNDSHTGTPGQLKKVFLPLEFCAGTFLRVQEAIKKRLHILISSDEAPPKFTCENIDRVINQLLNGRLDDLEENIIRAYKQDVPATIDRTKLICDNACELPQDLYDALIRSIEKKGSRGYYIQKGLSELFARINQYWPTFGVFWPSEVGAVGNARIEGDEVILNLQLMEIRYRLKEKKKHINP
ncbi:MAG: hypothetical protein ACTSVM_03075 [Candidatus Ranarchaeia archaeon]